VEADVDSGRGGSGRDEGTGGSTRETDTDEAIVSLTVGAASAADAAVVKVRVGVDASALCAGSEDADEEGSIAAFLIGALWLLYWELGLFELLWLLQVGNKGY
jgi:hypothetical protein